MSLIRIPVAALILAAIAIPAAAEVTLAPHRAVYDLAVAEGRPRADGADASVTGRMVFEFTGDACEGYTVNFRFVIETTDADFRTTVTDLRTSSFEAGDGETFQFLSQTYTDQVLTDEVKGTATRTEDGAKVDLVEPEDRTIVFERQPIFPTTHVRRILEAAEDGRTVLEQVVFDGAETGDKVYATTAVIGPPRTTPAGPDARRIGDMIRWPVSVAYFDDSVAGDRVPEYAISFDLWENGVSTDLTMDYGDFALSGTLVDYEALPETECAEGG